jgi:hypothetical protein
MINPNQNLNTPRTPQGFRDMLASLGPGGAAATSNFIALAQMSGGQVDAGSISDYSFNFPLISQAVFSRIADGSSGLSIPADAGRAWMAGRTYVAPVIAPSSPVQSAPITLADIQAEAAAPAVGISLPMDTSQNSVMGGVIEQAPATSNNKTVIAVVIGLAVLGLVIAKVA